MAYNINNLQENGGNFVTSTAGTYNPLAQTVFTYYGKGIIYGDGSTEIPSEFRTNNHVCPFDAKDIQDSSVG